jgi:hypothetical protein
VQQRVTHTPVNCTGYAADNLYSLQQIAKQAAASIAVLA